MERRDLVGMIGGAKKCPPRAVSIIRPELCVRQMFDTSSAWWDIFVATSQRVRGSGGQFSAKPYLEHVKLFHDPK